ncbi:DUF1295 domain-containing protein [Ferrimonas lipolytica]|uniref:DUF1295 domain-containing protein n=1 Tax=Ferrimonas lipolytica TaxID=2724191 RepID=A0A6H1UG35_9GAMM|nr:DUF1295 domain-containing protein [Ferrimonas lipolytica]QIZ77283.1 DUF1295 domain-containing protein [Ferrimonas lipolytica]
MKYITPLLPFLGGWLVLMLSNNFAAISAINGVLQLLLFALVVCWPTWTTGRMSYVDIGWPWGLVIIALVTMTFAQGEAQRVTAVVLAYGFAGSRMGLEALRMWRLGELQTELPRYQYQHRRWQRLGKTNVKLTMQIETILQALGNASFLALPAFIISANPSPTISIFEVIGLVIWLAAFAMEAMADRQKQQFVKSMQAAGKTNQVCNVGLWRYSRHPNYFAEWMVWNGLIIAAIPSWLALYNGETLLIWALCGAGLLFTSRIMYTTLVYYTGAVPAEFYSVQKRPSYRAYQQSTNRFFPGKPRHTVVSTSPTHTPAE